MKCVKDNLITKEEHIHTLEIIRSAGTITDMLIGSSITILGGPIAAGLTAIGAPAMLTGLLVDVALNTVPFAVSMIGFVFGVNLVFGLIEEVGYMARVSYVFDSTMARLGLQGKAVMPFLVSFGCAIGGAAGTRVIDSWGQKVLTIALAWVVPCAATWTIVPYLSSLYFGRGAPLVVVAVFLVAALHMFITVKVIFVVSLIFWLLTCTCTGNPETTLLYRFGRFIEPVTLFFGLTWQTFLAFISSAVCKEAALGVLPTLYVGRGSLFASTLGGAGTSANLGEVLSAAITQPQALAFIFAVTFIVPCPMAISSSNQETHSLKLSVEMGPGQSAGL